MKQNIAIFVPGGIDKPNKAYIPAINNLLIGLAKQNNITVFSLYRFDSEDFTVLNPYQVISTRKSNKSRAFFYIIILIYKFLKLHRKKHFTVIHGFWGLPQGVIAVFLAKLIRQKSLVSLQGGEFANLPEIKYGHQRYILLKWLTLWTCRNSDQLVCLTKYIRDKMIPFKFNTPIQIIPLGVDLEQFKVSLKPINHPVRFLFVANLLPVKNPKMMLSCFSHFIKTYPATLKIIGANFLDDELKKIVAQNNLKPFVGFQDYIPHDNLPQFFDWADILIHTSLYEAQAVAVAEAAASGLLICGTNVGLIYDLDDSAKITSEDPDKLAEKIIKVIENTKLYDSIRANSHQWAVKHDMDWTIEQYCLLYQNIRK